MNYNFYFNNDKEASLFVERAREIAKEYGKVTLADLYDLKGALSHYSDNKIGWSVYSINNNVYTSFNSYLKCYVVSFPQPFFNENKPKSYVDKKELVNSSGPINVTICMNILEDPF